MKLFSMKNISSNTCSITLMGLIILGVLYILVNRKEGFMSEMPFPSTMETAMLAPPNGDYPLMPSGPCKPGVSDESYSREWKEYPYTPMASYAQITNNKEFWSNPNNGTSTPPDINGGLYGKKKVVYPSPVPMPPNNPTNGVRVNYYVAK